MKQNMKTWLIPWFAFIAGVFFGLWMARSLNAWEGWLGISLNVAIIWIVHRMSSDIRRLPPAPKA
jgi:hypothetical protein